MPTACLVQNMELSSEEQVYKIIFTVLDDLELCEQIFILNIDLKSIFSIPQKFQTNYFPNLIFFQVPNPYTSMPKMKLKKHAEINSNFGQCEDLGADLSF